MALFWDFVKLFVALFHFIGGLLIEKVNEDNFKGGH